MEPAAELVAQPAVGHRVERPAGDEERPRIAGRPVATRSRNSMVIGCGNFGALPQPPLAGSNEASIPAVAIASRSGVGSSVASLEP